MAKCTDCRKYDSVETIWEKIASWFAWHVVPKTLKDEINAAHTRGFESGYNCGREHERENKHYQQLIEDLNGRN